MERSLTPVEIVKELDKYIVGQKEAKRAVAIALRNRWRRRMVPENLRDEIYPKNILTIGPTGVGKTEVARRLAKLVQAPFLKVEATKYTEVGYVGKDVDSMIRDLVEIAVNMVKNEEKEKVLEKAKENAEERLLDLLLPENSPQTSSGTSVDNSTREKMRTLLHNGELDNREIKINIREKPHGATFEIFAVPGLEEMDMNIREMLSQFAPKRNKKRKMKVPEALSYLEQEEAQKLVDMDKVISIALERVQNNGIIFLDEMDKIAESYQEYRSASVSREGVQRDLLPIVEGTTVNTKYGPVKTDHILFIGAGAFHQAKPSDLIPELQGRFPIRVEFNSLSSEDFIRILKEPENNLVKQYQALLSTEGVTVEFSDDAILSIAEIAFFVNEHTENIGARRLHTIVEKVMDELSFRAPELSGQKITITANYVKERVSDLSKNVDLSRYIL